jgi:hypothetical protein
MTEPTPRTTLATGLRDCLERVDPLGVGLLAEDFDVERDVDDRDVPLFEDALDEPGELRDRGGEDIRVATLAGYVVVPPVTCVTRRRPPTRDPRIPVARSADCGRAIRGLWRQQRTM